MPQQKIPVRIGANNTHFLPAPPWSPEWPPVCRSAKASNLDLAPTDLDRSTPADVIDRTIKLFVATGHTANVQRSHAGPTAFVCNRDVQPALAAAVGWPSPSSLLFD